MSVHNLYSDDFKWQEFFPFLLEESNTYNRKQQNYITRNVKSNDEIIYWEVFV